MKTFGIRFQKRQKRRTLAQGSSAADLSRSLRTDSENEKRKEKGALLSERINYRYETLQQNSYGHEAD